MHGKPFVAAFKRLLLCGALAISHGAFARGGDLDPAFGNGGSVFPLPPYSMALSPDGTIVLVALFPARLLRRLPDGSPDPSFGVAGEVSLAAFHILGPTVAVQSDGSIVVAGVLPGSCQLGVVRFHRDGSRDTMFAGNGAWTSACQSAELIGLQLAVLDDDRIMALAYPYRLWTHELYSPLIVRLDRSGFPDAGYGVNGIAQAPFQNPSDKPQSVIFGDGSVEFVHFAPLNTLWASRLRRDGSAASAPVRLPMPVPTAFPYRVSMLRDRSRLYHGVDPARGDRAMLIRFGPDDRLMEGFGEGGKAIVSIPGNLHVTHAFSTPDGGLLLVLDGLLADTSHVVVKLDAKGRPDPAFGSAGRIDFTGGSHGESQSMYELLMQPDGYALVGGGIYRPTGWGDAYLARLQAIGDVVEFRNEFLHHYFIATDGEEARGIDAGAAGAGWSRTGFGFKPGGTTPVCRFYGTPGIGPNSHFYTADPAECEMVKRDPGWTYEGLGFYTTPAVAGACEAPLRPVHRLYNNRWMFNDSNHRYVTDLSLIAPMEASGWIHEGVAFCARP